MKKFVSHLVILILLSLTSGSCDVSNGPEANQEQLSFLNAIPNVEIPMNAVSPKFTLLVNNRKFNIDRISVNISISNNDLIDSSGITLSIRKDSINFIIEPKAGKNGESLVSLVVSDMVISDTARINIKVTVDDYNKAYPSKLYQLETGVLGAMQSRCPYELDKYGLISYSGTLSRGQSSITSADQAVDLAKKAIVLYSSFSNVFSGSSLEVKEVSNYNPTPLPINDWVVIFKNQIYEGLEVINTGIITVVLNKVESIKGHHFNNIIVPKENVIPRERIKKLLTGQKFKYYCWGPVEEEIKSESISDNISKKIYWKEIDNYIELRVVWDIPIFASGSQSVSWNVLVDVLSGEIIEVIPRFEC